MDAITENLWREVHDHIASFERLARRTLEEAWQAGDKLIMLKQQTPHGQWLPSLKERGISVHLAERMMRLRRKYPEILQIAEFDSVQAALSTKKTKPAQKKVKHSPYLLSADDLWDWDLGEPSSLVRRFLIQEELQQFSQAVWDAEEHYIRECENDEELGAALALFRVALSCFVDIGPLESNPGAMAETKRRISAFYGGQVDWIEDPGHFLRIIPRVSAARIAALNGSSSHDQDE